MGRVIQGPNIPTFPPSSVLDLIMQKRTLCQKEGKNEFIHTL